MNKKIIFSLVALLVTAIIAFLLTTVFLAVSGSYKDSNPRIVGYFIIGSFGLLYFLSLLLIWRYKKNDATQLNPWNYLAVFLLSEFFGPGAAYLITWQNLRRMGKQVEAKNFLIFGGIIFVLMITGIYLIQDNFGKILSYIISAGFPIWLYYAYQRKWQLDNPDKVKFSWSVAGWALLGTFLAVIIIFILSFIIH